MSPSLCMNAPSFHCHTYCAHHSQIAPLKSATSTRCFAVLWFVFSLVFFIPELQLKKKKDIELKVRNLIYPNHVYLLVHELCRVATCKKGPVTKETLCLFPYFIPFHFSFFFSLGSEWRALQSVCGDERRSAAAPGRLLGTYPDPSRPGSRPAGKHSASGGITRQTEPRSVLLDSRKQHISCQRPRKPADCCRRREVWPPRLETPINFESQSGGRERRRRRPDSRHGFPSGRSMFNFEESPISGMDAKPWGRFIHVTEPH